MELEILGNLFNFISVWDTIYHQTKTTQPAGPTALFKRKIFSGP